MKARTFEDLMVWQKANRLSKSFPKHELFGLSS